MNQPFLSVVVPAYNEFLRIGKSLEKIRRYLESKDFASELIVVDDGSTDRTPELLREVAASFPAMRVLRNEPNRGKGFSVRRGVLDARGELILFTDADLSAPIEDADKLLEAIKSSQADAAVGSRAWSERWWGLISRGSGSTAVAPSTSWYAWLPGLACAT